MKKVVVTIIIVVGMVLAFLVNTDRIEIIKVKEHYVPIDEVIEEKDLPSDVSLSLIMVGDALIHESVYADAKDSNGNYDFKPMLEEIKPIVSEYDLAYYNQETILGGKEIGLSTYPQFNSPYEVGDAFVDAGFNLVSLANNHTLDRGEKAIINSCNYWKNKRAYVAGSYCSMDERNYIKVRERNYISYAMLSYTTVDNGLKRPNGKEYYLNLYDPEQVKKDVEQYRDKVDVLMVAMHWGEEYTHRPVEEEREIANYLASLGVDIVIGSHPHVVQPIEYIDNTLVIYSLGNFISAQRGIEKLTGLMVSLNINKNLQTNKVTLSDIEAKLLYTYSDTKKGYRGNFKVYPYTKLNDSLLSNHEEYYNRYMDVVVGDKDYIKRGDYSGNTK